MKKEYDIIGPNRGAGNLLNGHTGEMLSIGIMDTSTREDLENTLLWYLKSIKIPYYVVTQQDRFTNEEMTLRYPDVTFIVFNRVPSVARMLNAMANVCISKYFFATRSDASLFGFEYNTMLSLFSADNRTAIVCPRFRNKNNEFIPSLRMPKLLDKNIVDPQTAWPDEKADCETLYPFMGMGIYDRALFQRLRGFDEGLSKTFWQAMDFGTRCWLYGYRIVIAHDFDCVFEGKQFIVEDRTETVDTNRFYTRCLTVRFKRGRVGFRHVRKQDRKLFAEEVKPRRNLFRMDYETLCENWKKQ